jgi:hypothetical protein
MMRNSLFASLVGVFLVVLCCGELFGTYEVMGGSLFRTVRGIMALAAAIVLPPLAKAPIVVCMWWIGCTPRGTLGICKSKKSSSVLSLEFSILEPNALISLLENCLQNLASTRSK